jgi:hypothetical protein
LSSFIAIANDSIMGHGFSMPKPPSFPPNFTNRVTIPTGEGRIEYLDFPLVSENSPAKPNRHYFVSELVKGTRVGIHRRGQYPLFFKLFQRACAEQRIKLKLTCRQVAPDLWLLVPRKPSEPKPGSLLNGAWRRHGRTQFLVTQLIRGEALEFSDPGEATKIRRAWLNKVRAADRCGRECVIERRGRKHRLTIRSVRTS